MLFTDSQKQEIKRQLISFAVTFVSVFLVTFGTGLSENSSALEMSTLISLLLALSRLAVKVAFEQAIKPLSAWIFTFITLRLGIKK